MEGANVVNLTSDTFVHHKAERFGDVLDVHVATLLQSFAVDGELPVGHCQLNKLWNQLFWILTGTVNVVPSSDNDRQVVRNLVRVAEHLGACLGCSVRIGWAHGSCAFVELTFVFGILIILAVNLVRADMNKTLDAAVVP